MTASPLRPALFTALLVASALAPARALEVRHEVRGAGLALRWTLDDDAANSVSSMFLTVADGAGRPVLRLRLAADEREVYLDQWLDEGESLTVRLFVRKGGSSYVPAPPLTVAGPFHQVDLRAAGSVSDVTGKGCRVQAKLPAGQTAAIDVWQGATLLGTVNAGETETVLTGLTPGTRYQIALVPRQVKDGTPLRGRRTVLEPFTTPLSCAWIPANAGRRLNGDEEVLARWGRYPQAFQDGEGNLLFTFPTENLGTGMGRFCAKSRAWEVRGLDGWTIDHAATQRPIFDGLFRVRRFRPFKAGKSDLHVIANVSVSSGKKVLDIHGSLHHFRWSGGRWEQYAGGTSFSRYDSRPLFNSWDGSGAGWGFDTNQKGVGLAVHVKGSLSANGRLIAVRLDPRDPKSRWSVWRDGKWQPHGYACSFLPDPSPPRALEDGQPRVVSLDGKDRWLVVFQRTPDNRKVKPFWTALLYDDRQPAWLRWTKTGWKPEGDLVPFWTDGPDPRTLRAFRERGNRVVFLGQRGSTLFRWDYRHRKRHGGKAKQVARLRIRGQYAPSYAAAPTPSGKLLVAYSSDGYGITVHGKGRIHVSRNPIVLGGLGFVRKTPVVFFVSGGELKAVSERALTAEKPSPAPAPAKRPAQDPDGRVVTYLGSFINYATDPVVPAGSRMPVRPSYGPQVSGHMAATTEGLVFAPRFVVCNVCIFPPGHPAKPATFWGGFWDYFLFPMGCAVDEARGKVYVAHRVTSGGCGGILGGVVDVWDLAEAAKCHWSKPGLRGKSKPRAVKPGRVADTFRWPSGMAVDGERGFLYVANSLTCDVRKFRLSGPEPKRIAVVGEGELDFPRGVAVGPKGNVYVVDSRHHRICVFDGAGKLVRSFGRAGREPGAFLYPWGIAVCPVSGLVFVSDPHNGRVQAFTGEGTLVTWWSKFAARSLDGSKSRPSPVVDPRARSGPSGNHEETFGLACDGKGFLYVSTGRHIAKFRVKKAK